MHTVHTVQCTDYCTVFTQDTDEYPSQGRNETRKKVLNPRHNFLMKAKTIILHRSTLFIPSFFFIIFCNCSTSSLDPITTHNILCNSYSSFFIIYPLYLVLNLVSAILYPWTTFIFYPLFVIYNWSSLILILYPFSLILFDLAFYPLVLIDPPWSCILYPLSLIDPLWSWSSILYSGTISHGFYP